MSMWECPKCEVTFMGEEIDLDDLVCQNCGRVEVVQVSSPSQDEVLSILNSLIDGNPDDELGESLQRVKEYVQAT